ncbi:MAG: NUDIX hydrolase [Bacteroidota bacterium]
MQNLKLLKSEKRHAGKVFDLIVDEVEYPSGNRAIREVASHPGGAVIVPLLDRSTLLLIKQFRYPMHEVLYEFPAGKLNEGEDPGLCAKRELAEETGYDAGTMKKLGRIYTSPGFCSEILHLYLATDLIQSPHGPQLEEGELGLSVEPTSITTVASMIHNGTIVDAKTICGFHLALKTIGGST